jgi:hypothetical protein
MSTTQPNSKIKINMDALKTRQEWVRHKVKSGNNVFRILPPFGDNANGYPYRKWQIIWGLQDPESGRTRPFASSMATEKRDPVFEFVDELKARLTQMEGDLKARGLDEKTVRKHPKFERLSKFTRDITPKTTYIYNAVDKAGVVGLLELKSSAHKDMKAKMNEYIQDYNQDPTSLNSDEDDSGVWFNVLRSGEGFDTEYKVEKVQTKQKVGGQLTFVDDRSPLPEVLVQNFANLAYDLSSIYKSTTYDELNEILQANLDKFYEICPEANLSVPINLDEDDAPAAAPAAAVKPLPAKIAAPQGKKPVALIKDEEDEVPAKAKRAVPAPAVADDDDFMKAADEILKG